MFIQKYVYLVVSLSRGRFIYRQVYLEVCLSSGKFIQRQVHLEVGLSIGRFIQKQDYLEVGLSTSRFIQRQVYLEVCLSRCRLCAKKNLIYHNYLSHCVCLLVVVGRVLSGGRFLCDEEKGFLAGNILKLFDFLSCFEFERTRFSLTICRIVCHLQRSGLSEKKLFFSQLFVAWCVISLHEDCHLEVGFCLMVCHVIV